MCPPLQQSPEGEGKWLSSPGQYSKLVEDLCDVDPRLKYPDPQDYQTSWSFAEPNVVRFNLTTEGLFLKTEVYSKLEDLQNDLVGCMAHEQNQRTVLLVEGLSPHLINVLGTHFEIHPSVFVNQGKIALTNYWSNISTGCNIDKTIATPVSHSGSTYTMRYFEMLQISPPLNSTRVKCGDTGRHMSVTELVGGVASLGILRRKCTVWTKQLGSNGWICLIFVDPPLKRITTGNGYGRCSHVVTLPYQGGYIDFTDHDSQMKVRKGPPRTSLLNDMCFYLEHHGKWLFEQGGAVLDNPDTPSLFAKKIIGSHYLRMMDFHQSIVSAPYLVFSHQDDLARLETGDIERYWNDVQAGERRSGEYCDEIEDVLIQLGIPFERPNPSLCTGWADYRQDFQFVYARMQAIRHRSEQVNAAMIGLATMVENRQAFLAQQIGVQHSEQSLSASRSMKALTIVGIIFIPLAFTSSLFSMTEHFVPGSKYFWVYFAVAIPLVLLVVFGYIILDWGFNSKVEWSYGVLLRSVREKQRDSLDTDASKHC